MRLSALTLAFGINLLAPAHSSADPALVGQQKCLSNMLPSRRIEYLLNNHKLQLGGYLFERLQAPVQKINWSGAVVLPTSNNVPVTLLNVWSTWCPPCIKEFPELIRMSRRMETDRDSKLKGRFQFILLAETPDDAKLQQFLTTNRAELYLDDWSKLPVSIYKDQDGIFRRTLLKELLTQNMEQPADVGMPVTLILDNEGVIRQTFVGSLRYRLAEVEASIKNLAVISIIDDKPAKAGTENVKATRGPALSNSVSPPANAELPRSPIGNRSLDDKTLAKPRATTFSPQPNAVGTAANPSPKKTPAVKPNGYKEVPAGTNIREMKKSPNATSPPPTKPRTAEQHSSILKRKPRKKDLAQLSLSPDNGKAPHK